MKFTKFIIAAILPLPIYVSSCGDEETVDSTNLGRTVEFPEMSAQERGYSNGEIFGKSLLAICDSVVSAQDKKIPTNSPVFSGMLTAPFSHLQRPYVLSLENKSDDLWMKGFKEGVQVSAGTVVDADSFDQIMDALTNVSFSDIDNSNNAGMALQINEVMTRK